MNREEAIKIMSQMIKDEEGFYLIIQLKRTKWHSKHWSEKARSMKGKGIVIVAESC